MRIKVVDRRPYHPAIINPETNPELADLMNPLVKEFKINMITCDANRGPCYNNSKDFLKWLESKYPTQYKNLKAKGIQMIEGLFKVDDPRGIKMTLADINDYEMEEFMIWVGEDYDIDNEDFTLDLLEFLAERYEDDLDDLFYWNHGWVEVNGLIIDLTWQQFRHAINNKENLEERYHYL